ncbi:unnamed protein product [Phytophthora fragariaefolia]|uniref:Unnamed protein product n=1 Tax=Phytophthora fragariaefolia TaxID=1490495 RepID=A0A9W7D259_9STRA|nr:unnamed protein product [Phytophthora fragariaefolia]
MKPAETNHPVHDKELLAMRNALILFRVYLLGEQSFAVYTDHASLRTAMKSPHLSQRTARWLSFFAEYNFVVHYKPGKNNILADALSRRPDYDPRRLTRYPGAPDNEDDDEHCAVCMELGINATVSSSVLPLRQQIADAYDDDAFYAGLDVPVSTHQSKDFSWGYSCSFRMSTPTTQAAGTPAASAAANTVVANSATTGSSSASTSVVTSTVTTPSSPKRTMSLGEYKKTRGNTVFACDELEALFDVGSDADMDDEEEEDEGTSSSTRVDPSVGSRRPREDDSDASSSKRSRSGSNRPLADAGPLSSPRSGGDSTSSDTAVSRTGPGRDPWMPTPSEMESRFGSTAPPSQYALYSCSGINDDDVTKELDFDPATDQRRDYYIGHFHELRW